MKNLTRAISYLFIITLTTACGGGGGGGGGDTISDSDNFNNTNNEETIEASNAEAPSQARTITLSWTPPTTRADDSFLVLSEIGGYKVHYRLDGTPIDQAEVVDINSNQTNNYTTPALDPGTYHFAMATYDTNALHGPLSPATTITIE